MMMIIVMMMTMRMSMQNYDDDYCDDDDKEDENFDVDQVSEFSSGRHCRLDQTSCAPKNQAWICHKTKLVLTIVMAMMIIMMLSLSL